MNNLSLLQQIAILALPVLLAITVHEFAHGWAASKLGDQTAKMLGRVTLNPIKHIDPLGTVILPIAMYAMGNMLYGSGFLFGWAKPVPIGWKNFKKPNRDIALVAFAGPFANLLMAIIWIFVTLIGGALEPSIPWLAVPLVYMGIMGLHINTILLVLNLLPLPPLDGGRILTAVLPVRLSALVDKVEPFGLIILIGLLATGLLAKVLYPAIDLVKSVLLSMFVG